MDIAQRAVTLSLFGVTCYGAVVFIDGGVDIVGRRMNNGPIGAPGEGSTTEQQNTTQERK